MVLIHIIQHFLQFYEIFKISRHFNCPLVNFSLQEVSSQELVLPKISFMPGLTYQGWVHLMVNLSISIIHIQWGTLIIVTLGVGYTRLVY